MKKIALLEVLAATGAACFFLSGCDDEYNEPTETGGGCKSHPYIPAGNKNGGQYTHLDKK